MGSKLWSLDPTVEESKKGEDKYRSGL